MAAPSNELSADEYHVHNDDGNWADTDSIIGATSAASEYLTLPFRSVPPHLRQLVCQRTPTSAASSVSNPYALSASQAVSDAAGTSSGGNFAKAVSFPLSHAV